MELQERNSYNAIRYMLLTAIPSDPSRIQSQTVQAVPRLRGTLHNCGDTSLVTV